MFSPRYVRPFQQNFTPDNMATKSMMHHMCVCRYIIRLLEDLIFFVIGKETLQSTQRPSALTEEGEPDRDRQKLVREQEVLKEVREMGKRGE